MRTPSERKRRLLSELAKADARERGFRGAEARRRKRDPEEPQGRDAETGLAVEVEPEVAFTCEFERRLGY